MSLRLYGFYDIFDKIGNLHESFFSKNKDGKFEMKISVAGYGPEDVSIIYDKPFLDIKVPSSQVKVSVPKNADVEKTEAVVKNGMLTIVIPEREDNSSGFKITVR